MIFSSICTVLLLLWENKTFPIISVFLNSRQVQVTTLTTIDYKTHTHTQHLMERKLEMNNIICNIDTMHRNLSR